MQHQNFNLWILKVSFLKHDSVVRRKIYAIIILCDLKKKESGKCDIKNNVIHPINFIFNIDLRHDTKMFRKQAGTKNPYCFGTCSLNRVGWSIKTIMISVNQMYTDLRVKMSYIYIYIYMPCKKAVLQLP